LVSFLQGMKILNIGTNFNTFLFHASIQCIVIGWYWNIWKFNLKSAGHWFALNNQISKGSHYYTCWCNVTTLFYKLKYWIYMLFLLLLYYFHLFATYFIHNVPPQEEAVDLWPTNKSKTNVGIWSFARYATWKWISICPHRMHQHN